MFKKTGAKKKYIRKGIDQQAFFQALNEAGARYALLRWWKDFPHLAEGEDFDVLIHHDDYPLIEGMLTGQPGGLRCDVYFHDRPGGNASKKLPYFPLPLAEDILARRVLWKGLVHVPDPRSYFASLAFHGLYHKGYDGGILVPPEGPRAGLDHDYVAELTAAAAAAGISPPITAGGLHAWLTEQGYAPPLDMLGKLADRHPELIPFAGLPSFDEIRLTGELVLFVVRHAGAQDKAFLDAFTELLIEKARVEVLETYALSPEEVTRVSTLRGGNWSRGPYWKSAGRPAGFIICYDWYPKPANGNHALLLNGNITELKEGARKLYNRRRMFWNRCNPVHSPDNEAEAYEFLAAADASLLQRCRGMAEARRALLRSRHEVLEVLSEGRRSRTDLVRLGQEKGVQKTFRFGSEELCRNEVRARELLAAEVPMPALVEHSDNRIVMEFLPGGGALDTASLSKAEKHRIAERLVRVVHAFWKKGVFHADFAPGNIFVGPGEALHIIDFEFLQPYTGEKPPFAGAYEFEGIPPGETHYDRPWTDRVRCIRTHRKWKDMPWDEFFRPAIDKVLAEDGG